jgi:hypothetical protein
MGDSPQESGTGPAPERVWYDPNGNGVFAPADATTVYDTTGPWRTHRLFGAGNPAMLGIQTLCGLRGGRIPGDGEINCPECLDILRQPR